MADSKKKQTKVYLIPESESRDSHTYHYLAVKTKKLVIENQKLRLKKFNPAKQIHEWFVERQNKNLQRDAFEFTNKQNTDCRTFKNNSEARETHLTQH
jgi:large subunit ribosomal protein L33